MSVNQSKKFAYGTGAEASTDAYLQSVAGSDDRGLHSVEMEDTAHSRTYYTGGDLYGSAASDDYKNGCSRGFVAVLSVFFLLVGIGIIVIGAVQKHQQILALCPRCSDLVTLLYIVGGAMSGVGLLGMVACKTRVRPVAYVFTFLMIILAFAFLAAGAAAAVYQTGLKDFDTEKIWRDAVRNDESFICQLQTSLNCSGYGRCCNAPNFRRRPANVTMLEYMESTTMKDVEAVSPGDIPVCEVAPVPTASPGATPTPAPPVPTANGTAAPPEPLSAVCEASCYVSNSNLRPCDDAVQRDIKKYYVPIIGVGFGMAFILVIGSVSSVRMTFREKTY